MKITVSRKALAAAVKAIAPVTDRRGAPLFQRTVWLRADVGRRLLVLEFSGLVDEIQCQLYIPADIHDEDASPHGVTISALKNLLACAPEAMSMECGEGKCSLLLDGMGRLSVATNDAAWHMPHTFPDQSAARVVDISAFAQALRDVWTIASPDKGTEACNCVHIFANLHSLTAVAIDGHQYRSSCQSVRKDNWHMLLAASGMLLRRETVRYALPLLALCEASTACHSVVEASMKEPTRVQRITFLGSTGTLALRCADFEFPKLTEVLGKKETPCCVMEGEAAALLHTMKMLESFSTSSVRDVRICPPAAASFGPLRVTMSNPEGFDADLPFPMRVAYGSTTKVAFPVQALRRQFATYPKDDLVQMHLTSNEGPCFFTSKTTPHLLHIVMPMELYETTYYDEEDAEKAPC